VSRCRDGRLGRLWRSLGRQNAARQAESQNPGVFAARASDARRPCFFELAEPNIPLDPALICLHPASAAACLTLFLSFGVPLDIMAAIDIQSLSQLLQLSLDPRSNKQGGWICRLLCPGGCITAPPHC
jgi:hypothetical protein